MAYTEKTLFSLQKHRNNDSLVGSAPVQAPKGAVFLQFSTLARGGQSCPPTEVGFGQVEVWEWLEQTQT
jgi:hypothetical protein